MQKCHKQNVISFFRLTDKKRRMKCGPKQVILQITDAWVMTTSSSIIYTFLPSWCSYMLNTFAFFSWLGSCSRLLLSIGVLQCFLNYSAWNYFSALQINLKMNILVLFCSSCHLIDCFLDLTYEIHVALSVFTYGGGMAGLFIPKILHGQWSYCNMFICFYDSDCLRFVSA